MERTHLRPREVEALGLLAEGMSNAEIAAQMFISPRTVEALVHNASQVLGIHNRVLLAMYVWKEQHA